MNGQEAKVAKSGNWELGTGNWEKLIEESGEVLLAQMRVNPMSGRQHWKSVGILRWMPEKLPDDDYAMIAVTMTDLYPDESWNFVFGQASPRHRVGVFSVSRCGGNCRSSARRAVRMPRRPG